MPGRLEEMCAQVLVPVLTEGSQRLAQVSRAPSSRKSGWVASKCKMPKGGERSDMSL